MDRLLVKISPYVIGFLAIYGFISLSVNLLTK